MDVGSMTDLAREPLAQLVAAALALAGGWRLYRNQTSGDAVTRANDAANITALDTWKQLLDGERAARVKAEERADKFAAERNEAMQEVWEMRGQLKVMNETIAAQTRELVQLRDQVRQLQEKINEPR
jgi:chromosome segregation ATPase